MFCFIRTELNVLNCKYTDHLMALSFYFRERGVDGVVGEEDGRERRKAAKEGEDVRDCALNNCIIVFKITVNK